MIWLARLSGWELKRKRFIYDVKVTEIHFVQYGQAQIFKWSNNSENQFFHYAPSTYFYDSSSFLIQKIYSAYRLFWVFFDAS